MNKEILIEKIKYLTSMPHSSLVEHCIYLEDENDKYKAQKYITDFISENGIICEKNKEIKQLQSNWNSLREWLISEENNGSYSISFRDSFRNVLNKMNELESGDNK